MSTGASLLRGSVLRTLDLLVAAGAAFFITPYLVHAVGDRVYGFWTLVAAFIGYYGLLDLGLTSAAARYLSQALGRGDGAELERVAGTALLLFALVGAAVLALAAATAAACPLLVHAAAEARLLRRLLLVMGAAAAVSFPAKVYAGVLQAGLRHDALAAISIGRSLLYNGGIFACLRLGGGIVDVALLALAANALQYAATWAAWKALFPGTRVSPRAFDASRVRGMLSYGAKTLVCQLGDVLRFRLDTVLIAGFLGAALVTPYAVGARVVEAFVQLVFGSVAMLLPLFSRYEGQGDVPAMRTALLRSTKLTAVVSTFVGLSVIFYGRAFIRRWMGPGFDGAYGVAAILCAGYVLELPQTPGIQLLYGLSLHKYYAWLTTWEGLANLALSAWLVQRYGIYGVALGTTASFAFFKLLVQPRYICRPLGLPVAGYLRALAAPTLETAAALGLYFLAVRGLVRPGYRSLAACVAAQTALFAPLAYYFILGAEERRELRAAARAALPRRKARAAAAPAGL